MKWQLALALIAATTMSAQAQFMEDFDDGSASTRWSAPIVDAETGAFDGSVDYAYDYGAAGIGAAPNGGGSIGVRFLANTMDDGPDLDEGEAIGIIAEGVTMPEGDFVLKMDAYYIVEAGFEDFATEYVTLGAYTAAVNAPGSAGLEDDVPFRFVGTGNGLAFQVTGDGGSATDVLQLEDPGNLISGTSGITNLGSLDNIPYGNIPGVTTGGGNPNDPFEAFGWQNRWVTLSIESTGGMIDYKINGVSLLDEFGSPLVDNTGGTYTGGSIMIGLTDVFSSAAGLGVSTIIDNVMLIPIPEPSSALLGLFAACGVALGRHRR